MSTRRCRCCGRGRNKRTARQGYCERCSHCATGTNSPTIDWLVRRLQWLTR
jgi:hypothetical protein